MEAVYGLLLPFLGTTFGAACVFFLRRDLSDGIQRGLTGFAAGVMTAASIWSLLIPAIDRSAELGKWAFLPAVTGFWIGVLFLLALDHIIPHLHRSSGQPEGPSSQLRRTTMLVLAVTLHNIPEGMAAGLFVPALPYLLSFAAGAMLYVVVEEMIPEMSQGRHSNVGVLAFALGFSVMMVLDVALG